MYSIWQERKDLDLQQMVLETTALPIELRPYMAARLQFMRRSLNKEASYDSVWAGNTA